MVRYITNERSLTVRGGLDSGPHILEALDKLSTEERARWTQQPGYLQCFCKRVSHVRRRFDS